MARQEFKTASSRLPDGYRIRKRPLIRSQISSPYANAKQQKCVYISARSPFISSVKRIRKLQHEITKRTLGKLSIVDDETTPVRHSRMDKQKLQRISKKDSRPEPVYIRGTGKAIEKVIGLGNYFQSQEDCRIELKTYSVRTVDEIEKLEEEDEAEDLRVEDSAEAGNSDRMDTVSSTGASQTEHGMPDNKVRWLSGLEVAVFWK